MRTCQLNAEKIVLNNINLISQSFCDLLCDQILDFKIRVLEKLCRLKKAQQVLRTFDTYRMTQKKNIIDCAVLGQGLIRTVRFFLIATAILLIATNGLQSTHWKCSHYTTATSTTPIQPIMSKNK